MSNKLFKKTEAILYDYNNLNNEINMLYYEIVSMENEYKGCGAMGYEESSQSTNKFSSSVENEILQREKELSMYVEDLNDKIKIKRRIDAAIYGLAEEERKLVELRYFSKSKPTSWGVIGKTLSYSEDYCRKELRTKVINKLSDKIFYNPGVQQKLF